jgi:hypothetical protein
MEKKMRDIKTVKDELGQACFELGAQTDFIETDLKAQIEKANTDATSLLGNIKAKIKKLKKELSEIQESLKEAPAQATLTTLPEETKTDVSA